MNKQRKKTREESTLLSILLGQMQLDCLEHNHSIYSHRVRQKTTHYLEFIKRNVAMFSNKAFEIEPEEASNLLLVYERAVKKLVNMSLDELELFTRVSEDIEQ